MKKLEVVKTKEAQRQKMFKVADALTNTLEKSGTDDVVKILAVWTFSCEMVEKHFGKADGNRLTDAFAKIIFTQPGTT